MREFCCLRSGAAGEDGGNFSGETQNFTSPFGESRSNSPIPEGAKEKGNTSGFVSSEKQRVHDGKACRDLMLIFVVTLAALEEVAGAAKSEFPR